MSVGESPQPVNIGKEEAAISDQSFMNTHTWPRGKLRQTHEWSIGFLTRPCCVNTMYSLRTLSTFYVLTQGLLHSPTVFFMWFFKCKTLKHLTEMLINISITVHKFVLGQCVNGWPKDSPLLQDSSFVAHSTLRSKHSPFWAWALYYSKK